MLSSMLTILPKFNQISGWFSKVNHALLNLTVRETPANAVLQKVHETS